MLDRLQEVIVELVKTRNTLDTLQTKGSDQMRIILACFDHLTEQANALVQIKNELALKEHKEERAEQKKEE